MFYAANITRLAAELIKNNFLCSRMVSVVIIAKNEAHIIKQTLQSLQGLTDDIVVVDNGSTDDTAAICTHAGAVVIKAAWLGYGPTKNIGIKAAKYDWILSLDADEAIDEQLKQAVKNISTSGEHTVYNLNFKNFFCGKWVKYGEWGSDRHIRLFNRKTVQWDAATVHEQLQMPDQVKVVTLPGNVLHYTVYSLQDYMEKTLRYARLNAAKYFAQGKKSSFIKLRLSPAFSFVQNYLLRLGFMDGWEGYITAKTTAWYTFLKYAYLKEMWGGKEPTQQ
jgi:glycosyltransferase involved in cell wall biosynthesis